MKNYDKEINKICEEMGEAIAELLNKNAESKVKDIKKDCTDSGGVYVLWENEGNDRKAIYVGRAKNVYNRIKNHLSANIRISSFASHLTREKVAEKGGGDEYMVSSFYNKNTKSGGKTKREVESYIEKNKLKTEIKEEVKKRVGEMYFTCLKEEDRLQQALLEIFCMRIADTITKEEDPRANRNKEKKFRYAKYNFSY